MEKLFRIIERIEKERKARVMRGGYVEWRDDFAVLLPITGQIKMFAMR